MPIRQLRAALCQVIVNKKTQGHQVDGLAAELAALPDSYDALADFSERLADLPIRDDWPYVEPSDLSGILTECDPARVRGRLRPIDPAEAAGRVEAAFLGSVCGCVLGKPVEIDPTLAELRDALEATGAWPLDDYFSEDTLDRLPRPAHPSWIETARERIRHVAPDDDLNYSILGMLVLEQHGTQVTREQIQDAWVHHLPIGTTFGPERMQLVNAGLHTLLPMSILITEESPPPLAAPDFERWVTTLNPNDELCGALIRADAYGYACPGQPALAAELAWRDAGFTHRRTGIYGAMFVAAAIATAMVTDDRLAVFETALRYVPQRSRFAVIAGDCLELIASATDWLDGYARIHERYGRHSHCAVYQEVGTLMNTLAFAEDVGDGICKQVSQGNDTDSFGATAGSLLGAYFGPGHLDDRWLARFNDDIHTGLAWFYERSLTKLAARMGQLPLLTADQP